MILSNSFGGSSYRLKLHEAESRVRELNNAAASLARAAVDQYREIRGREAIVAGSIGPTGELFAPIGDLTHDAAVEAFTEQAEALAEGGVDVLWIETISAFEEVEARSSPPNPPFARCGHYDLRHRRQIDDGCLS